MAAITRIAFVVIFALSMAGTANAAQMRTGGFNSWLQDVEQEAVADGVSAETAHAALSEATYEDHVIELDEKQPETTITFAEYLHRTITPERVADGRRMLRENAAALQAVSTRYNVQPEVIVALWGMESSFGRHSGDNNVVDSLATLAYGGRRAEFFHKELIAALHVLDQAHIPSSSLLGSWAGAMGQCQFMPSTYLRHAASYTGSGAADIWDNTGDVFASIANYIAAEGWHGDQDWGEEVHLHHPISDSQVGLDVSHSLAEWSRMGVYESGSNGLAQDAVQKASMIAPDGVDGRHFLVYDNFRALMRWNRSTFFATSVGIFADRISDDR